MFFVLEDDGCVHVYASPDAAALHIEALDAEECIRAAFDDEGYPYGIEWVEPNKSGGLLHLLPWGASNGRYRLVPSGSADPAALLATFRDDRPIFADDLRAVEATLKRLREVVTAKQ